MLSAVGPPLSAPCTRRRARLGGSVKHQQSVPCCDSCRSHAPWPATRPQAYGAGAAGLVPVLPASSPWDAPNLSSSSRQIYDQQFAEMQQQLHREMDSMFSFGRTGRFEQQMERIDQQIDRQMRLMDEQMDRAFREMDQFNQDFDTEVARSMRRLVEQQPEVKIDRQEQRGPGMYRYYESIQIHAGRPMATIVPAHTTAPALFNPLLLLALVLTGAYAAVSAAFARNFDLTTYQQQRRWQLVLLWPLLALGSPRFREQMTSALRGEKVRVTKSSSQEGRPVQQQQQ